MITSVTEPDLGLKIPDALIHHSPKNKVLEKCFIFTFLIKFCELVNKFIDLSVSSKISKCHYSAQKKRFTLPKNNYLEVSVLPNLSEIFGNTLFAPHFKLFRSSG